MGRAAADDFRIWGLEEVVGGDIGVVALALEGLEICYGVAEVEVAAGGSIGRI